MTRQAALPVLYYK